MILKRDLLTCAYLRISYNQFSKLTPVIGSLSKLEALKADNNMIQALVPEVMSRVKLSKEKMRMATNFHSTPSTSQIGNLTRLKKLWLHKNKLLVLPPIIANLIFCKDLRLSHNQIEVLPCEIGRMTALRQLKCPFNLLKVRESENKYEKKVELLLI